MRGECLSDGLRFRETLSQEAHHFGDGNGYGTVLASLGGRPRRRQCCLLPRQVVAQKVPARQVENTYPVLPQKPEQPWFRHDRSPRTVHSVRRAVLHVDPRVSLTGKRLQMMNEVDKNL